MSSLFFIKLAFAYKAASTQCPRTGRKPCSAHVTVLSALGSALAATAPPRPAPAPPAPPWRGVCPEGGIGLIGPFRFLSRLRFLVLVANGEIQPKAKDSG
jgi:hypothetical protein